MKTVLATAVLTMIFAACGAAGPDTVTLLVEVSAPDEAALDQLAIAVFEDERPLTEVPVRKPEVPRALDPELESFRLVLDATLSGLDIIVRIDGYADGKAVMSGEGSDEPTVFTEEKIKVSLSAPALCGDGELRLVLEACDDGNLLDGDGCSRACQLEGAEGG